MPSLTDLAHLGQHVADGELVAARHRRDGVLDVLAGDDEQRVDEVVELELRLAHQVPDGGGAAEASHAVAGVVHAVVSFLRARVPNLRAAARRRQAEGGVGRARRRGGGAGGGGDAAGASGAAFAAASSSAALTTLAHRLAVAQVAGQHRRLGVETERLRDLLGRHLLAGHGHVGGDHVGDLAEPLDELEVRARGAQAVDVVGVGQQDPGRALAGQPLPGLLGAGGGGGEDEDVLGRRRPSPPRRCRCRCRWPAAARRPRGSPLPSRRSAPRAAA